MAQAESFTMVKEIGTKHIRTLEKVKLALALTLIESP
jgi:hypothetical protein